MTLQKLVPKDRIITAAFGRVRTSLTAGDFVVDVLPQQVIAFQELTSNSTATLSVTPTSCALVDADIPVVKGSLYSLPNFYDNTGVNNTMYFGTFYAEVPRWRTNVDSCTRTYSAFGIRGACIDVPPGFPGSAHSYQYDSTTITGLVVPYCLFPKTLEGVSSTFRFQRASSYSDVLDKKSVSDLAITEKGLKTLSSLSSSRFPTCGVPVIIEPSAYGSVKTVGTGPSLVDVRDLSTLFSRFISGVSLTSDGITKVNEKGYTLKGPKVWYTTVSSRRYISFINETPDQRSVVDLEWLILDGLDRMSVVAPRDLSHLRVIFYRLKKVRLKGHDYYVGYLMSYYLTDTRSVSFARLIGHSRKGDFVTIGQYDELPQITSKDISPVYGRDVSVKVTGYREDYVSLNLPSAVADSIPPRPSVIQRHDAGYGDDYELVLPTSESVDYASIDDYVIEVGERSSTNHSSHLPGSVSHHHMTDYGHTDNEHIRSTTMSINYLFPIGLITAVAVTGLFTFHYYPKYAVYKDYQRKLDKFGG